ncbi:SDR family oxidoreductase [Mesorhizobium sp.]|uniref:SDR family NAD(P)-dependent oxidoreductase n=1 Tax=Mesorhizobium sp. TaxID=1871066 RepID=UPI0012255EDA|nr:SDR family oxidoreductase [Mesorhizobium sp.]TIS55146.1 MAG: SDR family oxidoreductase [Mesorhizobium sp.]TIS90084.1 MAG: SDR family oxidoreductase [Mesorhizobium sp.]
MLLQNKTAVVYGAGGAVGSAVARAFASEGATVFLTGRNVALLDKVAADIIAEGGKAETATVDALDEDEVEKHLDETVEKTGGIDVSFNAIGIPQQGIQGTRLAELNADNFMLPIATYAKANFLTARGAGRRMAERRSGVILMHTPSPARLGNALVGGMGPAWAAMEALSRALSSEFGPQGIRAVCLRSTGIPETKTIDVVFGLHAKALDISRQQFQSFIEGMSHRRRSTTLAELANVATFLASDRAAAMTGAVANLTGGLIVD